MDSSTSKFFSRVSRAIPSAIANCSCVMPPAAPIATRSRISCVGLNFGRPRRSAFFLGTNRNFRKILPLPEKNLRVRGAPVNAPNPGNIYPRYPLSTFRSSPPPTPQQPHARDRLDDQHDDDEHREHGHVRTSRRSPSSRRTASVLRPVALAIVESL